MIAIEDIRAAAGRIAGRVRRTPMIEATQLKTTVTEAELVLKLELLQVTGSFKARGATNCLLATPRDRVERGIVAASGGNHGLAVARAGAMAGVPVTIFLPENVTPAKVEKLKLWGAEAIITGSVWDETNRSALSFVEETGRTYFHPFADTLVVAGQGTVALEILEQDREVDTLLVAIGGGGLISGVATAAKSLRPSIRVIGIEAEGSPTLKRSVEAGQVVGLEAVTTFVATMACARTDERVFDVVRRTVDEIVLVSDDDMRRAARWLWFELGLAADLSGAAAVAALQTGKVVLPTGIALAPSSAAPGRKRCCMTEDFVGRALLPFGFG